MKYNTKKETSKDTIVPKFFNTMTRKIEVFKPLKNKTVRMYNCGPTIYYFAHIGNFRAFVFADMLRRTLEFLGYKVTQVMNITDVGHLTSDDDLGEDKIIKGLRRERERTGKDITVYDIINLYTKHFKEDINKLNIKTPTYMPHASAHVEDMIKIIKTLVDKGYAYVTKHAVYFDVTKFKDYTKLSKQALDEKIVGARNEVNVDPEKKNPADFRLWQLDQPDHLMQWDSPWGKGFPGWHIECSAMSMHFLGETLDIHTGGVDHIPVHHTNEIAQSEAATGKQFSRFWMHTEFLTVEGGKMSKSLGNFYTLNDIIEMGYKPMHLRYFYLTAKYRTVLDFSKKALKDSANAYTKLLETYHVARSSYVQDFLKANGVNTKSFKELDRYFASLFLPSLQKVEYDITLKDLLKKKNFEDIKEIIKSFAEALAHDLNTPKALAAIWQILKDTNKPLESKLKVYTLVINVLGLKMEPSVSVYENLADSQSLDKVSLLLELVDKRNEARGNKDWNNADTIRDKISELGYNVIDMKKEGSIIIPKLA